MAPNLPVKQTWEKADPSNSTLKAASFTSTEDVTTDLTTSNSHSKNEFTFRPSGIHCSESNQTILIKSKSAPSALWTITRTRSKNIEMAVWIFPNIFDLRIPKTHGNSIAIINEVALSVRVGQKPHWSKMSIMKWLPICILRQIPFAQGYANLRNSSSTNFVPIDFTLTASKTNLQKI